MSNHVIYDRIWESKKLARCSKMAALAYPWIYLVADDYGRFEFIPRNVWAKVFGAREDITAKDVTSWLNEYVQHDLLQIYEAGGKRVGLWTRFVGPPPSKRRPSLLPDLDGSIDVEGLKACARFHSAAKPRGSADPKQETGSTSRKQEGEDGGAVALEGHWVREACDDWNERNGPGSASGGRIAGGIKRVVTAMAKTLGVSDYDAWTSTVRPAWRRYVNETTFPNPSAQNFAEHWGEYVPRAGAQIPLGKKTQATAESSRMFLEAVDAGSRDVRSAHEPAQGAPDTRGLRRIR